VSAGQPRARTEAYRRSFASVSGTCPGPSDPPRTPVTEFVPPHLLYLVHRLPYPPDKGDRIRAYHLIRHLASRARVHLACLADEPVPDESIQALEALCVRVRVVHVGPARWARALSSLARGGTVTAGAFSSPGLVRVLREWTSDTPFAAALASSSSMVSYLRRRELAGVPAVVDLVDVDSQKWFDYAAATRGARATLYRTEGRRLRKLEASLPSWARAVTLVSEAETELFRSFCPSPDVHTVPNGVDLDYFRQQSPALAEEGCVFVGALDYKPNVDGVTWFCKEVWPAVLRGHPNARLRLVGRQPVAEVLRLGEIPGVDVVGQVPDVRPHVSWAAVAVAPLRIARGLQNKVLEALAMRKPVVASPQALAGLRERLDLPALMAATPAEWAEHIGRLLIDEPLRRQLGAAGRRYVEAHHSWERCLEPLSDLLGLPAAGADLSAPVFAGGEVGP
jgi:polysaccharide biosynthesis protein PslH